MEQPEFTKQMQELITPQEGIMMGIPSLFTPEFSRNYYKPGKMWQAEADMLARKWSPDENDSLILNTNEGRRAREFVPSRFVAEMLGFKSANAAVSLESLDSMGFTVDDPKILGIINEETGKAEEVKDRDLTKEIYEKFENAGIDLHLRKKLKDKEQEPSAGEAKG